MPCTSKLYIDITLYFMRYLITRSNNSSNIGSNFQLTIPLFNIGN